MRTSLYKPDHLQYLYLDFDGFFASVEQQARPALRGKPVGVIPFKTTSHSCVIACSKEAKRQGVKNVMRIEEARAICPGLILVPQSPDLYRRAHNALISEISAVLPIEAIKSIDELTCRLEGRDRFRPEEISQAIKNRLINNIGKSLTCSIGFAANRQLAKMACKINKPDGLTIWHPQDMPAPLLDQPIEDVPGIGNRMTRRLIRAGIYSMKTLWHLDPKQMRKLWGNVTGERLWYALHGYDIHASRSKRAMFGHSRILPPDWRALENARNCSRLLLVKAARRLRRAGFFAGAMWLSLRGKDVSTSINFSWGKAIALYGVQDDQACLKGLDFLWEKAMREVPRQGRVKQVAVALYDLSEQGERQLDMFNELDPVRHKWEVIAALTDEINNKYGRTVLSLGSWHPPPGGYAGGKISYTRIPSMEDFW